MTHMSEDTGKISLLVGTCVGEVDGLLESTSDVEGFVEVAHGIVDAGKR